MLVYEVVTKFFDTGKVTVHFHTYDLEKKPDDRCDETSKCDIYHDYFTSKKKASEHYNNAKMA